MEGKQWNHEQTVVSRVCDISLRRSENGKDTFKTVLIKRGIKSHYQCSFCLAPTEWVELRPGEVFRTGTCPGLLVLCRLAQKRGVGEQPL